MFALGVPTGVDTIHSAMEMPVKRYTHIVVLVVLLVLVGCGERLPSTEWTVRIPAEYRGFLVIAYNCAGGPDIEQQMPHVVTAFGADGVFCTSSPAFVWQGRYVIQDGQGRDIQQGHPWSGTGYGFLDQGRKQQFGPPPREFSVFWVGQVEEFKAFRNDIRYEQELDAFFQQRFGFPLYPQLPE